MWRIASHEPRQRGAVGSSPARSLIRRKIMRHRSLTALVPVAALAAAVNFEVKNFDQISGSELVLLNVILSSNETPQQMGAQIEKIFAEPSPVTGSDQLRVETARCIAKVNAKVPDLNALTPDQMVQIQLIAGGSDSQGDKRALIEQIANENQ
jgi:hypothetical protein